jgi:hypothetical protein
VVLNHSIYAGANWGAGTGNANFFTPGFKGGESRINVDGNGYNTGVNELNHLPQMNIKKSIFGSGTSVIGGDVYSHIDLWNYGELEAAPPQGAGECAARRRLLLAQHGGALRGCHRRHLGLRQRPLFHHENRHHGLPRIQRGTVRGLAQYD